jgi:hypothetical protein
MKIKVAEATAPQLNWLAAKAQGWVDYPADPIEQGAVWHTHSSKSPFDRVVMKATYTPATDPAQAWPLLEREIMRWGMVVSADTESAFAEYGHSARYRGPDPRIAGLRCWIAFKLGIDVEIPEELA